MPQSCAFAGQAPGFARRRGGAATTCWGRAAAFRASRRRLRRKVHAKPRSREDVARAARLLPAVTRRDASSHEPPRASACPCSSRLRVNHCPPDRSSRRLAHAEARRRGDRVWGAAWLSGVSCKAAAAGSCEAEWQARGRIPPAPRPPCLCARPHPPRRAIGSDMQRSAGRLVIPLRQRANPRHARRRLGTLRRISIVSVVNAALSAASLSEGNLCV